MISNTRYIELARTYGTPLFVYDADLMLERYNDLFRFIPHEKLNIHYALKANYNPALLTILRDAGAGIDAVSPGEVVLALELGFAPEKIIYTSFGSPYVLYDHPYFENCTCVYGTYPVCQRSAVRYWCGEIEADGVLPVRPHKPQVKRWEF